MQTFFQKNADISKIKKALVQKDIFPETNYVCVLTYRISSIILTILRRGVILLPPPPQSEPLKSPLRLGLNTILYFRISQAIT